MLLLAIHGMLLKKLSLFLDPHRRYLSPSMSCPSSLQCSTSTYSTSSVYDKGSSACLAPPLFGTKILVLKLSPCYCNNSEKDASSRSTVIAPFCFIKIEKKCKIVFCDLINI